MRKLTDRWKGRRKDRRTNRQTLFYRTLLTNSGGPMIYLHFYVYVFCIIYLCIIYFTYAVSKCNVLRSIWFITYLKPIFVLNLPGWLYFLTSLLFFDMSLLYHYNSFQIINIFLSFSRDIYLSLVICNCLWIILLWIFWNFCDFLDIPLFY